MSTRVLYIEDDQDSQRLVSRVLSSFGYEVFLAKDGLEGVTLAREKQPHLVLIDINLPHLDGRATTTRLRSIPTLASIPIVALTANISPGNRELALAAGCTGFLTKPIDIDELPKQVSAFLHGYKHSLPEEARNQNLEQHARNLVEKLEAKVRELENINAQLYRLDRMKSEFLTLASHELRTPLTLVGGYSDILEKQLQQMTDLAMLPPILQVVEKLNKGVSRLKEIVDEIVRGARIATGALHLAWQPVLIGVLLAELEAYFLPICQTRNLTLQMENLRGLPAIVGDEEQLKTAVKNVIENGIKYTPDGGEISVSGQVLGGGIEIQIKDTGIGIPPEEQSYIFDEFHVLGPIDHHSTSKSAFQGGGLGLGLTIARGIIEAHNGRIWVESSGRDPDKLPGSTFHIWLPL